MNALGRDQAELRQMPAQRVDVHRALLDHQIPRLVEHQRGLLICALDRHEAHLRPRHSLADRRRVGRVVLAALHIGHGVGRRDQDDFMSHRRELASPVVRRAASLHAYPTRRDALEKLPEFPSREFPAHCRSSFLLDPMNLKKVLRQIHAKSDKGFHGRSPCSGAPATTTWHLMPLRWGRPYHHCEVRRMYSFALAQRRECISCRSARGRAVTASSALIASLGMYDFPWTAKANDALWAAMSARLREAGIDAPPKLTRGVDLHQIWRDPNLIFGQTCGYPYVTHLSGKAVLVATPIYAFPGCQGSSHRSVIIAHKTRARATLVDFAGARAAINGRDSNSGMNLFRVAIAPFAQGRPFFSEVLLTGSHEASLAAVSAGAADIAA